MNAAPGTGSAHARVPDGHASPGGTGTAVTAYVGLGANLGDAIGTVMQAATEISRLKGMLGSRLSPLYRSAPVNAAGPDYVNAVLQVETTLDPETLLGALQDIENHHGRLRPYRNAPRSLDLDLLLHGSEERHTDFLTLPHPRMHERAFVLMPLRDLAPTLVLPQGGLNALLADCGNQRLERLEQG